MQKALWSFAAVGAFIGVFITIFGCLGADDILQQIAAAAIGTACAVGPHCLARAADEIDKRTD